MRKKRKKRVGRGPGSGHGGTSCRGNKGQKARTGKKIRLGFEGGQMPLIRRVPKRGFSNERFRKERINIVNLSMLSSNLPEESKEIDVQTLREMGLIKRKGKVKVLGKGEIDRPLLIKADYFSRSARQKIEKAGGKAIISNK
ncbi:MAG: 50S ribosomal protein L15 [Candidatus Omnitrophota bacterium]|nr:MAG: 50S ribosomal protein L15 [Candidatus Omnitrophota bacterium]